MKTSTKLLLAAMLFAGLVFGLTGCSHRKEELQIAYANCAGEVIADAALAAMVGEPVEPVTLLEQCMARYGGGRREGQSLAAWLAEVQKAVE